MRQQRRALTTRRHEIADQKRDRSLQLAAEARAADAVVHPGAAALLRPGVEVDVKTAAWARTIADLEVLHAAVPGVGRVGGTDLDREQASDELEQAGQHPIHRKIRAQHFLADGKSLAA